MPRLIRAAIALIVVAAFLLPASPALADGAYATTVAADGPVSYWRLGEAGGSVAADTTGANPGSYKAGTTLGAIGALPADANTSVSFTGSAGYVSVPNGAALNLTDNRTVEAWAKPIALGGVTQAVVHKGGSTGNSVWQYRIGPTSANKWRGTV